MATYLDHAASTPLRPAARTALLAALESYANPSSIHSQGQQARALMDDARRILAEALDVRAERIIFTSGGSEANNLALRGVMSATPGKKLLVSGIEHDCIRKTGLALGAEVIPVTPEGLIDMPWLATRLAKGDVGLVSVMHANNETGVLQPVKDIAALAHQHGAFFHTDAVQTFGHADIRPDVLGADLLTLSGHKIGAPRGVGALVVKPELPFTSQITGGAQERNRRAGTENVPAIAAFAAAISDMLANQASESANYTALQTALHSGLATIPNVQIVAPASAKVPHILQLWLNGKTGEDTVIALDLQGISVSQGSACGSGRTTPSHVLKAMGWTDTNASEVIRVSLGPTSTLADVQAFLAALAKVSA